MNPRIYNSNADRQKEYREAKKLGMTCAEYRAHIAATITPTVTQSPAQRKPRSTKPPTVTPVRRTHLARPKGYGFSGTSTYCGKLMVRKIYDPVTSSFDSKREFDKIYNSKPLPIVVASDATCGRCEHLAWMDKQYNETHERRMGRLAQVEVVPTEIEPVKLWGISMPPAQKEAIEARDRAKVMRQSERWAKKRATQPEPVKTEVVSKVEGWDYDTCDCDPDSKHKEGYVCPKCVAWEIMLDRMKKIEQKGAK